MVTGADGNAPELAVVLGYHDVNDGGGGLFR